MKIKDFAEIYATLCNLSLQQSNSLVKRAFDTRRIDQTLEYIPRRNLQNYHRSEPHLDVKTADQVQTFFKIKSVADEIKRELETDPQWLDSYLRTLCGTLDQVLRVEQRDMDYSPTQFKYLNDMLYLRYRLTAEDISRMTGLEIRSVLLGRDEKLLYSSIHNNYQSLAKNSDSNQKGDFKTTSSPIVQQLEVKDSLMEKLFGEVKASKDKKEVERSVIITIKDKIVDDLVKNSSEE